MVPSGWIDRFKKMDNIVDRTPAGESMSDDSETAYDWKNDTYYAGKTRPFFGLQPSKSLTYRSDSCHGGS